MKRLVSIALSGAPAACGEIAENVLFFAALQAGIKTLLDEC
jgi:hypothetical protein